MRSNEYTTSAAVTFAPVSCQRAEERSFIVQTRPVSSQLQFSANLGVTTPDWSITIRLSYISEKKPSISFVFTESGSDVSAFSGMASLNVPPYTGAGAGVGASKAGVLVGSLASGVDSAFC